jgi:hypothetical protein
VILGHAAQQNESSNMLLGSVPVNQTGQEAMGLAEFRDRGRFHPSVLLDDGYELAIDVEGSSSVAPRLDPLARLSLAQGLDGTEGEGVEAVVIGLKGQLSHGLSIAQNLGFPITLKGDSWLPQ